jgi:hypothetical protein
MMRAWYNLNTNRIIVRGMRDALTGQFVNAALAASASVFDKGTGAAIVGAQGLPLTYVAGSNGDWVATAPPNVGVTLKQVLRIVILVDVDALVRLTKEIEARVVTNDS